MEIDITDFIRTAETHDFSASRMELGNDAAKITWNNAVREASSTQFITDTTRDQFESWARDFGAWEAAEIAAWSLNECNALLIQHIAGDLNELESLPWSDTDEFNINWKKADRLSNEGIIGGNIYKGDNGRVYFYMGN